jgi:hypothetical protein
MTKFFGFILLWLVSWPISAQLPSGTWRDHLPYGHGKKLAEYDNRIFCLTGDGSLYSYNTKDRSTDKYSKVTGLNDAEISTIGTSINTNTFFIGYSNGNIDLIRNDSIINIPDIKRKMLTGEKGINNVYFLGQYAYLACGFGIVLCDLVKREIKETYFFGPGGTQLSVNEITADEQNIYAATERGIYFADLQDPNLLDFNAWSKISTLPDPETAYEHIVIFNNALFTIYRQSASDQVISFDMNAWNVWPNSSAVHYEHMGIQQGNLILTTADNSKVYGNNDELVREIVSYYARFVLIDSQHKLWYAAAFGGLAMVDENGNGTLIAIEGPEFRDVGEIEISGGNTWVGGGTNNSQWKGYGAYSLINEKWKSYNSNTVPQLKDFLNIAEISIDPSDPGHVIGGSYGYGVAEFKDGQLIGLEDHRSGVFKQADGSVGDSGYIRVTGTDIDALGNMYAFTSISSTPLYMKPSGGQWKSVELDYENFGPNTNTSEILVNELNQVWMLIANRAVIIVAEMENGEKVRERFFQVNNGRGTAFDYVMSIAEDKEGSIWVGTNKGPVIYLNPGEVFDVPVVVGYQTPVPRRDGTDAASLLLASEQINDIQVDGANRKWLATQKSGVYLVSPDGKKEILHFTEDNSPLLSNSVQTIAVNDVTGEVMFGTDKGIIGYNAGATEAGDDFGDVYVFPNPVRETFNGTITVTGLARDVNVKITDIAGNLVFETTALGGQALWNGRNFNGDRVQTGVYLIFCTNEDGTKTFVTKLLFIH